MEFAICHKKRFANLRLQDATFYDRLRIGKVDEGGRSTGFVEAQYCWESPFLTPITSFLKEEYGFVISEMMFNFYKWNHVVGWHVDGAKRIAILTVDGVGMFSVAHMRNWSHRSEDVKDIQSFNVSKGDIIVIPNAKDAVHSITNFSDRTSLVVRDYTV